MTSLKIRSAESRKAVVDQYETVWKKSDFIFNELLTDEGLFQRPISLRNPLIFYSGHLPGFDYIHVVLRVCKGEPFNASFDAMFERGIDPDVDDPNKCHSHSELPKAWPPLDQIKDYIATTKSLVLKHFDKVMELQQTDENALYGRVFHLAWEHAMMHQETFFYMYHQLDSKYKRKPSSIPAPVIGNGRVAKSVISIPAGSVRLGATSDEIDFGWDNEFPSHSVSVPAFKMDSTCVTIGEFLEFVKSGEYDNKQHWRDEDYKWKQRTCLNHPVFWKKDDATSSYSVELVFGEYLPIESVAAWPAMVSYAEALAYATWKKRSVPTEAEWMRAAFTSPQDAADPRLYPWGNEQPTEAHANINWFNYGPTPVNSHPAGASAWGIQDLIGDAWEWTGTVFGPYPGFVAMENYPGYSSDFFDTKHYVLKGGSWATDQKLVRRSFRNWYQDRYPYMYAKFRLVTNE